MKNQFQHSKDEYENDVAPEIVKAKAKSTSKSSSARRSIRDIPLVRKSGSIMDITQDEIVEGVAEEIKAESHHHGSDSIHAREHLDMEHLKEDELERARNKPIKKRAIKREPAFTTADIDVDGVKGGKAKALYTGLIAVVLVLAIILMHTVFAHAEITISTPSQTTHIDKVKLADPVAYKAMTKNSEKNISIKNVKTVTVNNKATGTVTLYNNYNTSAYELVKTTRLETDNGSIYRLVQDVSIPGKKTVNGKDVPGTVTAKVEADKPGSEYNAKGGIDLHIPGLIKGTGKYVNIYAKTAANFTGGQTGTQADLKAPEAAAAIDTAKSEVESTVLSEFNASNPDMIILQDSITTTSSIASSKTSGDTTVLTIRFTTKAIGVARANIKTSLDKVLADKHMSVIENGLDSLTFNVTETPDRNLLQGTFMLEVEGDVQAGSLATAEGIKAQIAGQSETIASNIIEREMPGSKAEISIWPFWRSSIPSDIGKVEVVIGQ